MNFNSETPIVSPYGMGLYSHSAIFQLQSRIQLLAKLLTYHRRLVTQAYWTTFVGTHPELQQNSASCQAQLTNINVSNRSNSTWKSNKSPFYTGNKWGLSLNEPFLVLIRFIPNTNVRISSNNQQNSSSQKLSSSNQSPTYNISLVSGEGVLD